MVVYNDIMIEQYVYNLITEDTALQALLTDGDGGYHLYPLVIPRSETFDTVAVTFTTIGTTDSYPTVLSYNVQFNVFGFTHAQIVSVTEALSNLFNEDNNQSSGGTNVVFSIRQSQSDLEFDYDSKLYQREATYYFKIRQ